MALNTNQINSKVELKHKLLKTNTNLDYYNLAREKKKTPYLDYLKNFFLKKKSDT